MLGIGNFFQCVRPAALRSSWRQANYKFRPLYNDTVLGRENRQRQSPATPTASLLLSLPRSFQRTPNMASSSSAPKLRSLYRSFLRELPPRPILAQPRSPLHQRLREHFHPEASPSSQTQDNTVAQAEQYLAYVRAQRTYVTLLERYNPGMGMDEEERVRLTARRVGMDLPVEYGGEK